MIECYRGTGRCLTGDNFFSSMALVRALLEMRLTYCGTLRMNRREVPMIARNPNLAADEDLFLHNDESEVTLLRHRRGSKSVLLISSAHYSDSTVTVSSRSGTKNIPEIVDFYNCTKVGVDVADEMIANYTGQFPSRRW